MEAGHGGGTSSQHGAYFSLPDQGVMRHIGSSKLDFKTVRNVRGFETAFKSSRLNHKLKKSKRYVVYSPRESSMLLVFATLMLRQHCEIHANRSLDRKSVV